MKGILQLGNVRLTSCFTIVMPSTVSFFLVLSMMSMKQHRCTLIAQWNYWIRKNCVHYCSGRRQVQCFLKGDTPFYIILHEKTWFLGLWTVLSWTSWLVVLLVKIQIVERQTQKVSYNIPKSSSWVRIILRELAWRLSFNFLFCFKAVCFLPLWYFIFLKSSFNVCFR